MTTGNPANLRQISLDAIRVSDRTLRWLCPACVCTLWRVLPAGRLHMADSGIHPWARGPRHGHTPQHMEASSLDWPGTHYSAEHTPHPKTKSTPLVLVHGDALLFLFMVMTSFHVHGDALLSCSCPPLLVNGDSLFTLFMVISFLVHIDTQG